MMQNIDKNKELMEKLKKMIKEAEFLYKSEKDNWLVLVDSLDPKDLKEVITHFEKAALNYQDKKLEVIFKAGLGDEYLELIKKETNDYKKEAIQKEESHLKQTTENPEDVLQQLDNL